MKYIVNGILYDMNKSERIWIMDNESCLYRTKKGNWFIYHIGCKMPVEPIDKKRAMDIVEYQCSAERYIEVFGEVEEARCDGCYRSIKL